MLGVNSDMDMSSGSWSFYLCIAFAVVIVLANLFGNSKP